MWADHVQVGRPPGDPDNVIVRTLGADLPMPEWLLALISNAPEQATRDELEQFFDAQLGDAVPEVRANVSTWIDHIIASRALWIRFAA